MCVSQTGNRIKLIDFGLAQYYDGSSNLLFMAGTPEFVAPEVIKFEPIDFHTDMWSIGVITYILLSGISPFLGETLGETYCAVEKGEWEFDEEAFEGISDAAKDFISKLLVYDQKKRMLPEECLQHEWIVGSRARASNDLLLNQPNVGKPLSKEDGIGPSTSTATSSTSNAENADPIIAKTPTRTKDRVCENETAEMPLSVNSKKVKANEMNCETPEKKAKVEEETKELPKRPSASENKLKRGTDGCRRDDDWQINPTRNRAPINTASEINRKANSVATILSMFKEKDEVPIAPKLLERRSSRAGRTLRDVERPLKKMSSVLLDDLPPAEKTELLDVDKGKSENLEKDVKPSREKSVENTEKDHPSKAPLVEDGRRKVGVVSPSTTHEGNISQLEEIATHRKKALIKTESISEEVSVQNCCTDNIKKDFRGKADKPIKEKEEPTKVSAKETITTHCASMVVPMKFEKSSTMIVKTKMSVKNENKTAEKNVITKTLNGQHIEESHRSEKNAISIDVSKSKTTHNHNGHEPKPTVETDSRIAQFRSVALQAEMQKKITTNHDKGQTSVELAKVESTHTGKVHLAHENKLNDTSISKNSATAKAENQNTAMAKKVTTSTEGPLDAHTNESLTFSHKGNLLLSVFNDGKVSSKETSNKSSVKISAEKPPSGPGHKRRRAPKKADDSTLASDSDGSKMSSSEVHEKQGDSTDAEVKRSTDCPRSASSTDTLDQPIVRRNSRAAVSRVSSDASSESSDITSSEGKKKVTKKVKKEQATEEAHKVSDSFSNTNSKNQKSDSRVPQSGVETSAAPKSTSAKPQNDDKVMNKDEPGATRTLTPFNKENPVGVERTGKANGKGELTKNWNANGVTSSASVACTSQQNSNIEKPQKSTGLLKAAIVDFAAAESVAEGASESHKASLTADTKRKSMQKSKNSESSSEGTTKQSKFSAPKISGLQVYEMRQKRVEPNLSWRSELLKAFDERTKKSQNVKLDIPNTAKNGAKTTSTAVEISCVSHDKDGYGSDGEYLLQSSLKAIASDEKRKNEYRSLANIPMEAKSTQHGKLSKRKVTFSNEVLDPKPSTNKISIPPGFALSRIQSESNIAEKAKISLENSLKVRRRTLDDTGAERLKTIDIRREILAQQEKSKRPEVSSLGWLKTRMELRITDEKKGQTWRNKSEFKIPIGAAGNAKRALDMWRNMEQTTRNS
ncbi:Myosin light chain kinase, smooth muscle [Toxocara canis]|uniref:Myosin light chain kinase, smooth muscle n=1 Tax=Toxocara canis TaxID=6265 RepID=A0A0B2UVL2_TOXCA|nr:Myosin light chain kinase, smooth muscle [Toxocara canis]